MISKEIIWHLTCCECKNHWSYATTEAKWEPYNRIIYCPHCGARQLPNEEAFEDTSSQRELTDASGNMNNISKWKYE
jgi:hypothetical protein